MEVHHLHTNTSNPPPCHLVKTALLVIDMQNYFGTMMDAPLPYIRTLQGFFAFNKWPVIYTQHGHTIDDITPPITNQLVRKVGTSSAIMVTTLAPEEFSPYDRIKAS